LFLWLPGLLLHYNSVQLVEVLGRFHIITEPEEKEKKAGRQKSQSVMKNV
jgi:hypothetical protein